MQTTLTIKDTTVEGGLVKEGNYNFAFTLSDGKGTTTYKVLLLVFPSMYKEPVIVIDPIISNVTTNFVDQTNAIYLEGTVVVYNTTTDTTVISSVMPYYDSVDIFTSPTYKTSLSDQTTSLPILSTKILE